MKITSLELANVKRIKALRLEPTENGLTVIGGKNGQGKTSVLDAIAYAFGGAKYRPTNLKREGAVGDTIIHIETDNGLIIERKGKNAALTITDKEGERHGQAILDALISDLAINLPKFHNASTQDKAKILLRTLGIEEELLALEKEEKAKFDTRTIVGREADQKKKAAADMPWFENAPKTKMSIKELLEKQQEVLTRNGERAKARQELANNKNRLEQLKAKEELIRQDMFRIGEEIAGLTAAIANAKEVDADEDTTELEAQIADFEAINEKVKANEERTRREAEADVLQDQYDSLTAEIDEIRQKKLALLENAKFPISGLAIENGELTYDGKSWDCMSGSQQLIVDCAIASKLNPECRVVLLDKLEQLDLETLTEFGKWLETQDLQCIATRVSTGDECTLIIEDGEVTTEAKSMIVTSALPDEY
jgi:predicted ATP-dependent endonuclease of OLD family